MEYTPTRGSSCYALTSTGKRCKGYASIVSQDDDLITYSPTCARHKHFFDDQAKLKAHLFAPLRRARHASARWVEWYPSRRIFIENALTFGLLDITREDIAALTPNICWTGFILLCARHVDGFSMDWNKGVTCEALGRLWLWMGSIGPIYVTYNDLLSVIGNSHPSTFYKVLINYPMNRGIIVKDEWLRIFEAFSQTSFFESFLHYDKHDSAIDEVITRTRTTGNPLFEALTELPAWIAAKKQSYFTNLKTRFEPLKEPIIATGWHPSRFLRWCLDEDEKADMRGHWPGLTL